MLFSSSAAVYGAGTGHRLAEVAPLIPVNPYGWSKLHGERLLHAHAAKDGLRFVALRYFNVAGTENPHWLEPASPSVLSALCAALQAGTPPQINGHDYPSRDGTSVRDFIHAADVAQAHLAVAGLLDRDGCAATFNVGTGVGHTIGELLTHLGMLTGRPLSRLRGPRRAGDVAHSVADVNQLRRTVGWQAGHSFTQIISSHWNACQHTSGSTASARAPRPATSLI
ncbi:NAD-dependent epimerase/dehydratase family protein [Jatrophihabitans lederbergiae]|uniref:UDP-glucose 4-epimerase n=1 Tax=Jatrophihabitans lederbergiae TaxID=3075547 RepID=A0ABU2JG23_9ACTN|nr:NAD-dependent epimerase/dehydratase family protein [Jatrophihabitans sp. DSM 44399]MDT0263887.1 NAD-dependent epimerase/dehydratase family protein [Jatrophihabitans sp. DSM 44399]